MKVVLAHDAAGRMTSETEERGNTRTQSSDAANRRISTNALGNNMSYRYNAYGNMITQNNLYRYRNANGIRAGPAWID